MRRLEGVRSCRDDQEDAHVPDGTREREHAASDVGLGAVEVLDDPEGRQLLGEALGQAQAEPVDVLWRRFGSSRFSEKGLDDARIRVEVPGQARREIGRAEACPHRFHERAAPRTAVRTEERLRLLSAKGLQERGEERRSSRPELADDQDRLAGPLSRIAPRVVECAQLRLAAHEVRRLGCDRPRPARTRTGLGALLPPRRRLAFLEQGSQRRGGTEPILAHRLHQAHQDAPHEVAQGAAPVERGLDRGRGGTPEQRPAALGRTGQRAEGQLEEHPSERVEIGARVHVAGELLGRGVARASDEHARRRQPATAIVAERDSEVDDARAHRAVHDDVLGLEIAVHDAGGVHGLQPACHLAADLTEERVAEGPVLVQELAQVAPLHEFGDEVAALAGFGIDRAEGERPDHVGVVQAKPEGRFAREPSGRHVVRQEPGVHHLDADAFALLVAGGMHDAHAAPADLLLQRVRTHA